MRTVPYQTEQVQATKSHEVYKTLGQPYQAIDYTTMLQSIRTNIADAYHDVSLGYPLIPRDELLHFVYSPDEVSTRKRCFGLFTFHTGKLLVQNNTNP